MTQVYVRSAIGTAVTLPYGTQVGVVPTLLDNTSPDYTLGIANGDITLLSATAAQGLITQSPIPGALASGDVAPRLIATIPYTAFTATSSSIYQYYPGCLTRKAIARTVIVVNEMDEGVTSFGIFPYESLFGMEPVNVNSGFTWSSGPFSGGGQLIVSSELGASGNAGNLASHVDSAQLGIGIGAVLPTSGSVSVYIVETFSEVR